MTPLIAATRRAFRTAAGNVPEIFVLIEYVMSTSLFAPLVGVCHYGTIRLYWSILTKLRHKNQKGVKMPDSYDLDLNEPGTSELIKLTNTQFAFWEEALRNESAEMPSGNLMDYWFIISKLALYAPTFRVEKKDALLMFPNLGKPETVRKYIANAEKFGFVESVRAKGVLYLQLTNSGKKAIIRTLARWKTEFSKLQKEYFPDA